MKNLSKNEHFISTEKVHKLIENHLSDNGIKLSNKYIKPYYFGTVVGFIFESKDKESKVTEVLDNI